MAQTVSAARVPFGMLDDSRLQRLTNVKNKQNAIVPSPSPSSLLSKRKHVEDPFAQDVDSENVEPSYFSPKKSKLSSGNSMKSSLSSFAPSKPSHFILKTDNTSSLLGQAPSISSRHIATPKRAGARSILDSAPRTAPAGRSPRRKRSGQSSKRRTSAPFTRINPPAFGGLTESGSALPFSIDAALSGSVPSYRPSAPKQSVAAWESSVDSLAAKPSHSSWFFEIHEDTPEEELGNLMEFSTQTLDISDGESDSDKHRREKEERGKENVPPELSGIELPVAASTVPAPTSRKDMMSDEPRTPLGELEAREFYAEGCDAESVFIVPAEQDGADSSSSSNVKPTAIPTEVAASVQAEAEQGRDKHDTSPTDAKSNQDTWRELLARVDEQQKTLTAEVPTEQAEPAVETTAPEEVPLPTSEDDYWAVEATSRDEAPLFDIWESESAKEEGEEQDALAV